MPKKGRLRKKNNKKKAIKKEQKEKEKKKDPLTELSKLVKGLITKNLAGTNHNIDKPMKSDRDAIMLKEEKARSAELEKALETSKEVHKQELIKKDEVNQEKVANIAVQIEQERKLAQVMKQYNAEHINFLTAARTNDMEHMKREAELNFNVSQMKMQNDFQKKHHDNELAMKTREYERVLMDTNAKLEAANKQGERNLKFAENFFKNEMQRQTQLHEQQYVQQNAFTEALIKQQKIEHEQDKQKAEAQRDRIVAKEREKFIPENAKK
jgi:hypothetical protein